MTRLLVTTGPESSGKTTLAQQLSTALQAPLVTEASRAYLTELYRAQPGVRYRQDDLLQIARLQLQLEQQVLSRNPPCAVCDTDLLVLVIWSEVVFGTCAPDLRQRFEAALAATPRTYLLCDWHGIAWENDPLRENPYDRHVLQARYQDKLTELGLSWHLISGSREHRLQQVLQLKEAGAT